MQVVLVYLEFTPKMCIAALKIAKSLKPLFLGFNVVQGH